ncbi:hypothetical protein HPB49_022041 [Dermacentor silvarum]|uniref:Uncharacterized protein n=1 Tax=Dermacentor silvarum TaxID=543639 RepID=A0ACB8E3G8_DERSI|nr:uncharacterized protein LOC119438917 [Dermacentor silvarum]KAH7981144.1 hypothetical protein HPB49_022041 [Dermacentor silvarum]
MDGWVYTLTGFGDFFELRKVTFAEPMPESRVCSLCGVLPSLTHIIPCGHVLCELCLAQIAKSRGCPFDGEKFSLADVRSISFKRSELEQCRVFCCAGGGGYECGFAGQLSQLRNHLSQCGSGNAKCGKCLRPVVRGLSLQHCLQCSGDSVTREAVVVRSTTDRRLASVNSNVDGGRWREETPSWNVGPDAAANGANALTERVADLERELHDVRKRCHGRVNERSSSSFRASKRRASLTVIPGPYRAASRPGVLITTCKFADIYVGHESLKEGEDELRKSSDTYTLGGYTFRLNCQFSKEKHGKSVRFILHLRDGEWDGYVEWPFSKKVTLIIMHPRDAERDVRLPLPMDEHRMVKKPQAGAWNWGQWTAKIKWENIELRGFVDKDTLYVNVEFD